MYMCVIATKHTKRVTDISCSYSSCMCSFEMTVVCQQQLSIYFIRFVACLKLLRYMCHFIRIVQFPLFCIIISVVIEKSLNSNKILLSTANNFIAQMVTQTDKRSHTKAFHRRLKTNHWRAFICLKRKIVNQRSHSINCLPALHSTWV